jgi:CheY-like chemotaxis protein
VAAIGSSRLTSEIRSALLHLDDPVYLESHPLAQRLFPAPKGPAPSRGQLLRRALRLAIETLAPGNGTPATMLQARCYEVLHRYAIGRQSIVAIARELNISERQAYRALRYGTEAVARVLLPEETGTVSEGRSEPSGTDEARLEDALDQISSGSGDEVDIVGLVSGVIETARLLAQAKGVTIHLSSADAEGMRVTANRVMLRQALLNLASHAISCHAAGAIHVHLYRVESGVRIDFSYLPQPSEDVVEPGSPRAVAEQLLSMLGLRWGWTEDEEGAAHVSVYIPLRRQPSVLIVEDNEGLAQLFRRYLQREPYHVAVAHSYAQALEMMERVPPDVMIVDVLMPDRDGWEILQTLRTRDTSSRTRFIICSIINDPQLAAALGAHAFLHKPVSREQLVQTVAAVLSSSA